MLAERSLPPETWREVAGALELGLNTTVSDSTGKPPARGGTESSHAGQDHGRGSMKEAGKGEGVPEVVL